MPFYFLLPRPNGVVFCLAVFKAAYSFSLRGRKLAADTLCKKFAFFLIPEINGKYRLPGRTTASHTTRRMGWKLGEQNALVVITKIPGHLIPPLRAFLLIKGKASQVASPSMVSLYHKRGGNRPSGTAPGPGTSYIVCHQT